MKKGFPEYKIKQKPPTSIPEKPASGFPEFNVSPMSAIKTFSKIRQNTTISKIYVGLTGGLCACLIGYKISTLKYEDLLSPHLDEDKQPVGDPIEPYKPHQRLKFDDEQQIIVLIESGKYMAKRTVWNYEDLELDAAGKPVFNRQGFPCTKTWVSPIKQSEIDEFASDIKDKYIKPIYNKIKFW